MRGLLVRAAQADKVGALQKQPNRGEAIHAKFDTFPRGEPVVADDGWGICKLDATALFCSSSPSSPRAGLRRGSEPPRTGFSLQKPGVLRGPGLPRGRLRHLGRGGTRQHGEPERNASSNPAWSGALVGPRWAPTSMAPRRRQALLSCTSPSRGDAPAPRPPGPAARSRRARRWTVPAYRWNRYPAWARGRSPLVRTHQGQDPAGARRPVRLQTLFVAMATRRWWKDHPSPPLRSAKNCPVRKQSSADGPLFFAYELVHSLLRSRAGKEAWGWRRRLEAVSLEVDGLPLLPSSPGAAGGRFEANGSSPAARRGSPIANVPLPLDPEPHLAG